jgi:hypothetical protein
VADEVQDGEQGDDVLALALELHDAVGVGLHVQAADGFEVVHG